MGTLQQRFGMRLKLLRVSRGFTQEQFAELVDVSTAFISSVERGLNQPSFKNIERFAEILRVVEMELFDFSGLSQIHHDSGVRIRAPRKDSVLVVRHKRGSHRKPDSSN